MDPAELRRQLLQISDVNGIHELHVWQLGSDDATAVGTVHVSVARPERVHAVIARIKTVFHQFNVHRTTIEPEFADLSGSHPCGPDGTDEHCHEPVCNDGPCSSTLAHR